MNPTSGYSGTPLIKKLGYKEDETVYLQNAPVPFVSYLMSNNTKLVKQLPTDWFQAFYTSKTEFNKNLQGTNLNKITKGLWLCWPKRTSGLQTDLNEQDFRNALLPLGWVDTKVCAIDDTWSGLKFVHRRKQT